MKFAALVLSCSKPVYEERRKSQVETYEKLQQAGLDVFILLGDPTMSISYTKGHPYTHLYVPVAEDYELLPRRLWVAYQYLIQMGYTHICKLDDDIQFLPPSETLAHHFQLLKNIDYAALRGIGGREIAEKEGTIIVNTYHWKKCTNPILNKTYSVFPSIDYASGPCYWISANALAKCTDADFEKCIFEDVCLGIACKKYKVPLTDALPLFVSCMVSDTSPWPYTQYHLKNLTMYFDILNG
jgi:hypothetical protein